MAREEEADKGWKCLWGAEVKTPCDMPDDVIKDAILSCTAGMEGCADFEAQGNEVVEKIKRKFDQTWDPNWHARAGVPFPPSSERRLLAAFRPESLRGALDARPQVIIGKSFGSFVTHETKYFISFKMQNGYTAMLYKA